MKRGKDKLVENRSKDENINIEKNKKSNKQEFKEGMRAGIPIGLGYFAVSFTLGIAARNAGLTVFQGFLAAGLTLASAGGYAGFTLIASGGTYLEMALVTLIANIRYFLMSSALSQKLKPDMAMRHRFLIGTSVTDELFGISFTRSGWLNPYYFYGAMLTTLPTWAIGTAIGVFAGNILSASIVSALSVALYGMFLAIIIPAGKADKIIALLIIISFVVSFSVSKLAIFKDIKGGTRIIVLTIIIASLGALVFPVKDEVK